MKIVCVGQIKTGTKSMAKIFELCGFSVNSNPLCLNETDDFVLLDNNIEYFTDDLPEKVFKNIEYFEAFHDYPYSYSYEYIFKLHPDSKFILTVRNSEDWFYSFFYYQNIPGASNNKLINKLYGCEKFLIENKKNIIKIYKLYNQKIINFKDSLNKISTFLNVNIDFSLPCENKNINREDYLVKHDCVFDNVLYVNLYNCESNL